MIIFVHSGDIFKNFSKFFFFCFPIFEQCEVIDETASHLGVSTKSLPASKTCIECLRDFEKRIMKKNYFISQLTFTQKSIFEFRNFFMSELTKILLEMDEIQAQKKSTFPLFSQFLMKSPNNINKNALEFDVIS